MKVAFNTLALNSAHRERGIGYYTRKLLEGLKKDDSLIVSEFTSNLVVKDADVVHYSFFDFYYHSLPFTKSAPTVVTIHDVVPLIFKQHYPVGVRGRFNFILQKLALSNCKFIITDSQVSKEDIVKHLKINGQKIVTIPLAVDQSFTLLSDTKLLLTKKKYNLPNLFILYVGDANWVKNLPFLIDTFGELIKDASYNDLKLVLVGGVFLKNVEDIDHPELESLKQVNRMIKSLGLETKVIRVGYLEDEMLIAFYNLATVYAQPSFYEGFGLPILQSFACGTPVVSSKGGALPEVGGNAALYFDPSNLVQFKSLLKEVLSSKSLQSKLTKLGFEQVGKFSWDRVVKETRLVYAKALQK